MVESFFLDTSAILKRYKSELGTTRVEMLTDPDNEYQIILSEITLAETSAALAALHRASDGITIEERDAVLDIFLGHCATEYQLIAVNRSIINLAVDLTQKHRLRGCDSIQLATALVANKALISSDFPPCTFIAADNDLLKAALTEGLLIENPTL